MPYINDSSALPATANSAELERTHHEDALGKKILDAASQCGPMVMSTAESIRAGNEDIARAEQDAVANPATRIANGEVLSSGELQRAGRDAPSHQWHG